MRGKIDVQSYLLSKLLFTEFVKYIKLLSQDNVFKKETVRSKACGVTTASRLIYSQSWEVLEKLVLSISREQVLTAPGRTRS